MHQALQHHGPHATAQQHVPAPNHSYSLHACLRLTSSTSTQTCALQMTDVASCLLAGKLPSPSFSVGTREGRHFVGLASKPRSFQESEPGTDTTSKRAGHIPFGIGRQVAATKRPEVYLAGSATGQQKQHHARQQLHSACEGQAVLSASTPASVQHAAGTACTACTACVSPMRRMGALTRGPGTTHAGGV